jgi:hypothetical protein
MAEIEGDALLCDVWPKNSALLMIADSGTFVNTCKALASSRGYLPSW